MSEQEQLPVCVLCGNAPDESDDGCSVFCADVDCEMVGLWLTVGAWRRLMARPRLAPEHVEALMRTQDNLYCNIPMDLKDAIRAALAALGEE